jgi:hypothetical protein
MDSSSQRTIWNATVISGESSNNKSAHRNDRSQLCSDTEILALYPTHTPLVECFNTISSKVGSREDMIPYRDHMNILHNF